jgi:predicted anti-sigma-YlaC factor YlaD
MNCETFEELITAHLDGELVGAEAVGFGEHRLACTTCRALLEDVSAAITACSALPEVEPPLGLLSRSLVIPALNPPVDCERFASLVTEYLDGYLEPRVYHAFEDHAHACGDCSDVLAGVALAVSACHSVHFNEQEVPEALISRILAETSAVAAAEVAAEGWRGRVRRAFKLYAGPMWAPRLATAALIVTTFTALVTGGAFAPASVFERAARVTSRVYSRSVDLAERTDHVIYEVQRIGAEAEPAGEKE